MSQPTPRVAVVVLNWNRLDDTAECLESVDALCYGNLFPILVDNASVDGSPDVLATRFPDWTVLRNARNLGYAEGNNVGIRHALKSGADYVLMLNNDTRIDPLAVSRLVEVADGEPGIGVIGPRIYYWDREDTIWFDGGVVDRVTVEPHHEGLLEQRDGPADVPADTGYVSGCAMMLRAGVLRETGVLDADYFLVFEETDLCARILERGYRAVVVPSARVWHKVSVTFGGEESPVYLYYFHRNNLLYVHKRLRGARKLSGYFHVLKRQAHYIWHLYRNHKPYAGLHTRIMIRAIWDFLLRRWGEADLSGLA